MPVMRLDDFHQPRHPALVQRYPAASSKDSDTHKVDANTSDIFTGLSQ
jgi:hypothetical protein